MSQVSDLLERARVAHDAGRLDEAEASYRRLLALEVRACGPVQQSGTRPRGAAPLCRRCAAVRAVVAPTAASRQHAGGAFQRAHLLQSAGRGHRALWRDPRDRRAARRGAPQPGRGAAYAEPASGSDRRAHCAARAGSGRCGRGVQPGAVRVRDRRLCLGVTPPRSPLARVDAATAIAASRDSTLAAGRRSARCARHRPGGTGARRHAAVHPLRSSVGSAVRESPRAGPVSTRRFPATSPAGPARRRAGGRGARRDSTTTNRAA